MIMEVKALNLMVMEILLIEGRLLAIYVRLEKLFPVIFAFLAQLSQTIAFVC